MIMKYQTILARNKIFELNKNLPFENELFFI